MKRIHVFLIVILALIVAMALGTVIFTACNAPVPDDIEGIEIGLTEAAVPLAEANGAVRGMPPLRI